MVHTRSSACPLPLSQPHYSYGASAAAGRLAGRMRLNPPNQRPKTSRTRTPAVVRADWACHAEDVAGGTSLALKQTWSSCVYRGFARFAIAGLRTTRVGGRG